MSKFLKNTFISSASTLTAQLVPFLFSPIITRLYSPEVFGEFSTFLAVVTVLVAGAMLRFDFALMVSSDPKERQGLVSMSFFLLLLIVLVVTVLILLMKLFFTEDVPQIYLFLSPLLFLTGITQLFNQVFILNDLFLPNGKRKVFQSLSYNSSATGLGFLSPISTSLVLGQVFSHLVVFGFNLRRTRNLPETSIFYNRAVFKALFRKFISFPKKGLVSTFFNTLGSQSSLFLIPVLYGLGPAGLYALTVKLLYLPIQLIGRAISDSLFQQLSQNRENSLQLFRKITVSLFLVGLLPFTAIFLYGDFLFGWVFGEEWIKSGEFAKILAPFFLIRFTFAPQVSFFTSLNRLDLELRFNALFVITQVASLAIPFLAGGDIKDAILYMSISGSACYVYVAMLLHTVVKKAG